MQTDEIDRVIAGLTKPTRFYACASLERQIWGIRIARWYLTIAGPRHPAPDSERYGRSVRVLLSVGGWRIRLRTDRLKELETRDAG